MAGIDNNVKLLLHMRGLDASTVFTDDSPSAHISTAIGNAQIDTAQSKFGGSSLLLDGNGDCAQFSDSPDWDFATNPMAIDFWVRFDSVSGNQCFIGRPTSASSYFYLAYEGGGIRCRDYPSGFDINWGVIWTPVVDTWYHVALTRDGNNWRFFVNGIQKGTTIVNSGSFMLRDTVLQVGANAVIGYFVNGRMDEVRISNGDYRWNSNFTPPTWEYTGILQSDSLEILDSIEVIDTTIIQSENLKISDSIEIIDTTIFESESLEISDSIEIISTNTDAKYASRIISYNPLIIITDTNPIEIVKVNISNPSNITWSVYNIKNSKNAKDIVYNSVFDLFYIACKDGQILEVKGTDFAVRTQHNTQDIDDLLQITSLDGFHNVYAGTEDLEGEVIMMDRSEVTSLGMDIRFLAETKKSVGLVIDTVDAVSLGMDIRFSAESKNRVGLDIRFHSETNNPFPTVIPPANPDPNSPVPTAGAPLNPIAREDFKLYIDSVEATDVPLDSFLIYHTIDNKSTASFTLNRKHDQLNNRLDGSPSQITSQNNVEIKIKGVTEFIGEIQTIDCQSDTETVKIEALGDFKEDDRKTVILSLPSIDEQLHLYHALVHNPIFYTPTIEDDDENPEFYKGIKVDLGKYSRQRVLTTFPRLTGEALAEKITDGDFQPEQNWTHFWTIKSAENFSTGKEITNRYVGTSMSGFTTDLWYLNDLSSLKQREFNDFSTGEIQQWTHFSPGIGFVEVEEIFSSVTPPGGWGEGSGTWGIPNEYKTYYLIGEAPYDEISVRNGKHVSVDKYIDKPDGLYKQRDAGYDFLKYAKEVADISYEQLKNINGSIFPKTSASIELFIDGYYYYGISLLTRLNFDNTTTPSIYNSNNGFPVSIKGIEINSSTMKVTLKTDNNFSRLELLEIEENLPDEESEEYNFNAISIKMDSKYNPADDSFPE